MCKFKNKKLALQAITCSDFASKYRDVTKISIESQDALATFGDTVLKMIIAKHLLIKEKCNDSGKLTIIKSNLENNKSLNKIGIDKNMKDFLLYNDKELDGDKKYATSLEAIIGAIYLSNGIKDTKQFVSEYILSHLDEISSAVN
jgi:dsRNA-specific ribonuclease